MFKKIALGLGIFIFLLSGLFFVFVFSTKYCSHNLVFFTISPALLDKSDFDSEVRDGLVGGKWAERQFIKYNFFCPSPENFRVGDVVAFRDPANKSSISFAKIKTKANEDNMYDAIVQNEKETVTMQIKHDWIFARD